MTWLEFFNHLGIVGIITTAAVFIIRHFVNSFFEKDLEKYKAELKKEISSHKIIFSALHAERATVIKKVYGYIIIVKYTFEFLILPYHENDLESLEDKLKDAHKKLKKLFEYYEENRLFFDEALAVKIDAFIDTISNISVSFEEIERENWHQLFLFMKKEVDPLKEAIEKEFRSIIGIESKETNE